MLLLANSLLHVMFVRKKTKDSTSFSTGLLHPLLIPTFIFNSWIMSFITDFPLPQDYNAIFLHINCSTKYIKLIPCFIWQDFLTTEKIALFFIPNVVQYFGIPTSFIYDRDPRFTSNFWKSSWKPFTLYVIAISTHYLHYMMNPMKLSHPLNQQACQSEVNRLLFFI